MKTEYQNTKCPFSFPLSFLNNNKVIVLAQCSRIMNQKKRMNTRLNYEALPWGYILSIAVPYWYSFFLNNSLKQRGKKQWTHLCMFLITHSSTYFLFMAPKWPWQIHDLTSVSFIYKLQKCIQCQVTMCSHFVPQHKNTTASFSATKLYRNLYVYEGYLKWTRCSNETSFMHWSLFPFRKVRFFHFCQKHKKSV